MWNWFLLKEILFYHHWTRWTILYCHYWRESTRRNVIVGQSGNIGLSGYDLLRIWIHVHGVKSRRIYGKNYKLVIISTLSVFWGWLEKLMIGAREHFLRRRQIVLHCIFFHFQFHIVWICFQINADIILLHVWVLEWILFGFSHWFFCSWLVLQILMNIYIIICWTIELKNELMLDD